MNRQFSAFLKMLMLGVLLGPGSSHAQKEQQHNLSTPKNSTTMIVVKVTYTVKEDYVSANKALIQTFLSDFKKLDPSLFLYSIFQSEDGKTFIHTSQYKNKEIQQTLLNTASFLHFQEERDKNLASEPKIEFLNYVGASKEVI